MSTIYLDTSVLIASLKPKDKDHICARKILDSGLTKKISYITVTEMISVVSRLIQACQIQLSDEARELLDPLSFDKKIKAIVLYIILRYNINVIGCLGVVHSGIDRVELPIEFAEAIKIAPKTRLKTLDNLHIATFKLNKKPECLDFLVTGDRDMLNKAAEIREIIETLILSPEEASKKLVV